MLGWDESAATLLFPDQTTVAYPADCIRHVRLGLPFMFLSDCTIRLGVTNPERIVKDDFDVKLRFRDRNTAKAVAKRLRETFAV